MQPLGDGEDEQKKFDGQRERLHHGTVAECDEEIK